MSIVQTLMQSADRYSAEAVALFLLAAALSFVARYHAQERYGRIREYGATAWGVAAVLLAMAVFYGFVAVGGVELMRRPVFFRILLSLLSVAMVGLNWGGVRVAIRDVSQKLRGASS